MYSKAEVMQTEFDDCLEMTMWVWQDVKIQLLSNFVLFHGDEGDLYP